MKKILIISYFFPPSNFVGGERAAAWFNYLQSEGFYPVVVTRCWNEGQSDVIGELEHNSYSIERVGNGEIHRVPVPRDLRNKIGGPIRKFLTLRRLLSRNTDAPVNEFKTMYVKCVDILKEDPEIKTVIASGRPFESFQIGYLLKKEFAITWIPDYRDEWSTHLAPANESWIWRKIHKQEKTFEKVWTSNADQFLSVSPSWVDRIGIFIQKEGTVIMNGYEQLTYHSQNESSPEPKLHLLYAGSLYGAQNIELLIRIVDKLQREHRSIGLTFIGTEIMAVQQQRLKALTDKMKNVNFQDRIPKSKLHEIQTKADALIMTSFENVDGWLPVKMFDYFASGKPILVCPSDRGVIDEFISKTNSGICINDEEELEKQLIDWCKMKENGQSIYFERNLEAGKKYSREYQTKRLTKLLDSL